MAPSTLSVTVIKLSVSPTPPCVTAEEERTRQRTARLVHSAILRFISWFVECFSSHSAMFCFELNVLLNVLVLTPRCFVLN